VERCRLDPRPVIPTGPAIRRGAEFIKARVEREESSGPGADDGRARPGLRLLFRQGASVLNPFLSTGAKDMDSASGFLAGVPPHGWKGSQWAIANPSRAK
jgi:hypothetical protein